ncbi:MAG TPA: glycosyltransferase [Candidatus Paceibacterota bacterium]|nr:glycosyltransferase [Candidatus Paceibacterota bacterium]
MQKILQVNKLYYPWIGGVETVVQQIAEGLRDKAQMEVLVCQPKGKGRTEVINGIKIHKAASWGMTMGMPISLSFFRLFKKLIKENDLIFLHHPYPLGFLAYYLFGRSKKMVVWYHSDIVKQKFSGFLFSPILRAVLKKSRKIFVSNPNLFESSGMLKKFQNKCVVVPFGIKPEFFQASGGILEQAQEIRKKFGEPLVLAIGRLTNYKGFEYLIEASRNVNAKFLLIGEGTLKNKLLRRIRRFHLGNKFFLIPPVSDLLPYYHACDVFVLPSTKKSEAFGLVLLGAMACAKPVISTRLGTGTSFVNQDKKTGFVVEPKNSSSLAKSLNDLITDDALKAALGQRAKEWAGGFALEKFLEKVWSELAS